MKAPDDAVIAVTHRCNAHCVMCNIWKSRQSDTLMPEHLRKLPPGLKTINLSGGEPFLRKDLPEFVREARARCPGAQITLSTNGYLPERITEVMDAIRRIDPRVRLAVSLDGIESAHDRIRGDEGAFRHALELIERLQASGYAGLRLGMTLSDQNLDQLLEVAELAERHGLELGVVAAHSARTHLNVERAPLGTMPEWVVRPFHRILHGWLLSWRPKLWLRAHFAFHTYRYLAGRPWRFRCRAGSDFFFLQADGAVYSCSVRGRAMGNLIEQEWDEIWKGAPAGEARAFSRTCPECCWMICTARSVYRRRALRVLAWIAGNKVRAHLGLLRMPPPAPREKGSSGADPAR